MNTITNVNSAPANTSNHPPRTSYAWPFLPILHGKTSHATIIKIGNLRLDVRHNQTDL